MGEKSVSLIAIIVAWLLNCSLSACQAYGAEHSEPIQVGSIAAFPSATPTVFTQESGYIIPILLNVTNINDRQWFSSGTPRVMIGFQLEQDSNVKWNFFAAWDQNKGRLSQLSPHQPIGPRRVPALPSLATRGPRLRMFIMQSADMFESATINLDVPLRSIYLPLNTAALRSVQSVALGYDRLLQPLFLSRWEFPEFNILGPRFAGNAFDIGLPLAGNIVYVVLSPSNVGSLAIDLPWVQKHLRLSDNGAVLVYKSDMSFLDGTNTKLTKRAGEAFDLAAYILFRFDPSSTEIEESKLLSDKDLRQQFEEVQVSPVLFERKWRHISDILDASHLFTWPDIILVRAALNQFMESGNNPKCRSWEEFWHDCWIRDPKTLKDAYETLPPKDKKIDIEQFERVTGEMFRDTTRLANLKNELQATVTANRQFMQKALKTLGHSPGKIDGVWGKQTVDAVRRFQRDTGFQPNGIVDLQTFDALEKAYLRYGSGRNIQS